MRRTAVQVCKSWTDTTGDKAHQCTEYPVPANQVVRGEISFSHIKPNGAAWGEGYTVSGTTVNTNGADFK